MRASLLGNRVVARTAVAVLTIGLCALAVLAVWSTTTTNRATRRVGTNNQIADGWGELFSHINLEQDALRSYLATRDEDQERALNQVIGGGDATLEVLQRLGDAAHKADANRVTDEYREYTDLMNGVLVVPPADRQKVGADAQTAAAALDQDVLVSMASDRLRTNNYVNGVNQESSGLRIASTVAFCVSLGVLGLCSAVLLGYQRRVERQAASSRHEALHDSLTGLANRVLLREQATVAVEQARREHHQVALLVLDVDRFKEVNDTLGHDCGDKLLRQLAVHLADAVRHDDTVARLGGDEFAVLLPRISGVQEAIDVGQRLQTALRQPVDLDGFAMELSGCIGLAVYPDHSGDADQLLQHADIAMSVAKSGRSDIVQYDHSQNNYNPQHLTLLGELRHAIENGELVLFYQPKADASTGRVSGVEALVRWQHPGRGLLGPGEFVQLAEQGGLIEQLTDAVLSAAIEQCASWHRAGIDLPIAVNMSALCLSNDDLPDTVGRLLREKALDPAMLTLEITESALIDDPPGVLRRLRRIRELGVRLSIDDFGTGYSSMAYLQEMPISELKIDRCFVSQMISDTSNRAIVGAVLDLARNLDLQVVAEGVEDQDTWTALDASGCHTIQGFYLSRPLPPGDLAAWLAEHPVATPTFAA